jgi:transposase
VYKDKHLWQTIRRRVLVEGESIRAVAAGCGMSRNTVRKILDSPDPPKYQRPKLVTAKEVHIKTHSEKSNGGELDRWMKWLYRVERRELTETEDSGLISQLDGATLTARKKILTVLAAAHEFSAGQIGKHLLISKNTALKYLRSFKSGGIAELLQPKAYPRKSEDPAIRDALFKLLHEPPALSGFNRTAWRISDLREALLRQNISVGSTLISKVIRSAGYRWRKAKVVLTSNDPEYREKLARVQGILSNLKPSERFFSVDEFGPFAIKIKAGKKLVGPDEYPSVPQWQKSKGWLIATAALELSQNQVTHFYSRAKNTAEMVKMVKVLLAQYAEASCLYVSWDAASWHASKELNKFVDANNASRSGPQIVLVPLPASAQFLNVIESVFSGMARAIIHSSNYQSEEDARKAIDKYFEDRNTNFKNNPKRAGKKIWGLERAPAAFNLSNNCKDPSFR